MGGGEGGQNILGFRCLCVCGGGFFFVRGKGEKKLQTGVQVHTSKTSSRW